LLSAALTSAPRRANCRVAFVSSTHQGGAAIVVGSVDIGAAPRQRLTTSTCPQPAANITAVTEAALGEGSIDIGAAPRQRLHDRRVPLASSKHHCRDAIGAEFRQRNVSFCPTNLSRTKLKV